MKQTTENLKSLIATIAVITFISTVSAQKPLIEWASISAGTFTMGSPTDEVSREADETRHQVTLSAFKMSRQDITVAQFKAFVDATGYVTDADKGTGGVSGSGMWTGTKFEFKEGVNWKCDEKGNPRPSIEYNQPVIHVSWNDAVAFADWMGCRLPTESEWEYACRAGTTTPFNTGSNLTTAQANYNGNYPYKNNEKGIFRDRTLPVGSFAANGWGLYDMHGNVWEWCHDWYGDYSTGVQTDPKGPASGSDRVLRGGSWRTDVLDCRAANRGNGEPDRRGNGEPDRRSNGIGFRLVSPR